jgi:hypothetical protein
MRIMLSSSHLLFVRHLLHRNEEGIQINMEDTASHETVYKLAHRADKANFPSNCLMRASAVETNRAHNPEVVGSNPTPATK